ncbi:MAG: hypothetical protein DCC52_01930, partial [Chloroflexi bacterium]
MKVFENYHLPTSVSEALILLAQYEGRARVVAGGTDLLVDSQTEYYEGQRPHYDALVDVTRLAGANEIYEQDGFIVVGCAVTHTQIVASSLIQQRATALAEACAVVLMALEAEASVASLQALVPSNQWKPLAKIFLGPGQSAVDSTRELITALRFRPLGKNRASAFARVMRPQGVALPILGMATCAHIENRKSEIEIQDVAISAGPVAPVPFRAAQTEEFLRGKILGDAVLQTAAEILAKEARPRTSAHRATKEYRYELLPALL